MLSASPAPLRILIPNRRPADSFVDNVAFTLEAMGHDVRTLTASSNRWMNSPARRLVRQAARVLHPEGPTPEERWLLHTARSWRPHAVLTLTQALSEPTLQALGQLGVYRAVWWGDTPANMSGQGLVVRGWDAIYIKDTFAAQKLAGLGLPAVQLNEACNPAWHRPLQGRVNDEVVIAGTFYDYRHLLTQRLIEAGVEVGLYGGRLPRWAAPAIQARHTGHFVVREEKARVFGAGKACLNSTAMREFDALNCRAFEIAGCGGLHLLEYRPAVEECFEPGREVVTFTTFEELLDVLARLDREPAWADAIRAAGARRAHAEHTYQHRLERILAPLQPLRS